MINCVSTITKVVICHGLLLYVPGTKTWGHIVMYTYFVNLKCEM